MTVLAPCEKKEKSLTKDEKNMRWALNKFYYNQNRNTLKVAYNMMLREKYTDGEGKLLQSYPFYHQFRYFYSKTKRMQTYYISRGWCERLSKKPWTTDREWSSGFCLYSWLWYVRFDNLKGLGFHWAKQKQMWYMHFVDYHKFEKKTADMDYIRSKYGSVKSKQNRKKAKIGG